MKFCENCGCQLEDDDMFCESCGVKQEEIANINSSNNPVSSSSSQCLTQTINAQKNDVQYSNSNNVESTDKRDMSATFGQILLSILLPIVGLIYGFVIKKDGRNKAGNTCIIISIIVMVLLWIFE